MGIFVKSVSVGSTNANKNLKYDRYENETALVNFAFVCLGSSNLFLWQLNFEQSFPLTKGFHSQEHRE